MTGANLVTRDQPQMGLASQSAVPAGLQITTDVRLRQAQAEMLSRYQLALMLPRSWEAVGAKLVAACENPDFARVAFYRKPAGNTAIEGLSVRFAELAQQLMRNISVDTSPEMEDATSVHYRMTVTDLESNTPVSETFKVEKTVERRYVDENTTILSQRPNSNGDIVYLIPATEEQVQTKLRAQISKVKRTLILSLVPAEVRAQCLALCRSISQKEDAKDPQAATKSIIAAFLSLGIDVPDLKEYLGHSPSSLVAKEIEDLRGIYALIRDGEMIWNDVLEAKREQVATKGSRKDFVEGKKAARDKRKQQEGGGKSAGGGRASRGSRQAEGGAGSGGGTPAASKDGGETAKTEDGGKASEGGKAEPAPRARASRRGGEEAAKAADSEGGVDGDGPPPDSNPPT